VRWRTHFGYKKWQIFLLNIGLFWSHTRLFCNTQETRTRANLHQRSQAIVHSHAVYTTWQIPLSRMSVPIRIHIRVSFVLQKSPIFNQMCCKRAPYLIESHPRIHWMFHMSLFCCKRALCSTKCVVKEPYIWSKATLTSTECSTQDTHQQKMSHIERCPHSSFTSSFSSHTWMRHEPHI